MCVCVSVDVSVPYTVAEGLTALTLSSVAVTGAGVMTSLQYIDVCVCVC